LTSDEHASSCRHHTLDLRFIVFLFRETFGIAYNWTEAAFKNISPIWFVFYLVALDYRQPEFHSFQRVETVGSDEAEKLIYAQDETNASPSGF